MALKRELNDVQNKVNTAQTALAATDKATAELQAKMAELNGQIEGLTHERRDAEREAANSGAALRQMETEVSRLERRLEEWTLSRAATRMPRTRRLI